MSLTPRPVRGVGVRGCPENDDVEFVLGALVVGAIALARELFVDRARWKREQEGYNRVTRGAQRLIADELDTARNHMALMLKHKRWPMPTAAERADFLSAKEWVRHKDRLAEALTDENTWIALAAFYYSLGQLRTRVMGEGQGGQSIRPVEVDRMQLMHDQATALQTVLGEDAPLPDDWQEEMRALREAGRLPLVIEDEN